MTKSAQHVPEQAMRLDDDDRAELIERLSVTLEPSTDPDYVAAWETELRKRIEQHQSDKTKGIPWEQVFNKII